MAARNVYGTRGEHFRAGLVTRGKVYFLLAAAAAAVAIQATTHDAAWTLGTLGVALLVAVGLAWSAASEEAAHEFFTAFAPTVGMRYMVTGALTPVTPLLAAGDSQECSHVMEGPIFGGAGGPLCTLAHFTYTVETADRSSGRQTEAHRFTVAALEVEALPPVFHGVYLRRRRGIRLPGFLGVDWLARTHAAEVDLESFDFEEQYELRVARDQDPLAVRGLFSPSFVAWLAAHPLRPGFECKAGMLVVFIPDHETSADRLTLFHDSAREIARRVMAEIASTRVLTPAR